MKYFDRISTIQMAEPIPPLENVEDNPELKQLGTRLFEGKKIRRTSSNTKLYIGDHIGVSDISEYQSIIEEFNGEHLLFADRLSRLTDRSHMAESVLFVLTNHFCILNSRLGPNDTIPTYEIGLIQKISTSKQTDNAIVIHLPDYHSELLMTPFKTELVSILYQQYQAITRNELPIEFQDTIRLPVSEAADFEINFVRGGSGVKMTLFCVASESRVV